jgi:hypothetical protein
MMMRIAMLLAIVCVPTILSAQAIADDDGGLKSGPLFDAPARMDSILFEASFVSCDAATANAVARNHRPT